MRRVVGVRAAGTWPDADSVADVTLAFAERYRRRFRLCDDRGAPFLLDLAQVVQLGDGDGLELAEGGIIRVRAAAEPVADLRAGTPAATARLAWHIGNRHVPLQVLDDGSLRIRDDHVLADMARGLGATVAQRVAPFAPEAGAYAGNHGGGHGHDEEPEKG